MSTRDGTSTLTHVPTVRESTRGRPASSTKVHGITAENMVTAYRLTRLETGTTAVGKMDSGMGMETYGRRRGGGHIRAGLYLVKNMVTLLFGGRHLMGEGTMGG